MKIYLGYECYYNYCDAFQTVVKVFDCEVKALVWKDEVVATETEYRNYQEMDVE